MAAENQTEKQKKKQKKKTATTTAEKKEKSVQGAERGLSQSNETDGAKQEHESEPSDLQQLVDILARAIKRGDQSNEMKRNV